jgi:hypothetical protein
VIFVKHRVNEIEELAELRDGDGVEVDVRDGAKTLVVSHDPFAAGAPRFREWLCHLGHQCPLLVVNVKCEGIVDHALAMAWGHEKVAEAVVLDCPPPELGRRLDEGRAEPCMARYTRTEPAPLFLAGQVDWIWAERPARYKVQELRANGFKVCLCSPEVLPGGDPDEIPEWAEMFAADQLDAVCTKAPARWRREWSL